MTRAAIMAYDNFQKQPGPAHRKRHRKATANPAEPSSGDDDAPLMVFYDGIEWQTGGHSWIHEKVRKCFEDGEVADGVIIGYTPEGISEGKPDPRLEPYPT